MIILKGEHILDGLSGMTKAESDRLISLKLEMFNLDGTPKKVTTAEQNCKAQELVLLLHKRNTLWGAMLN